MATMLSRRISLLSSDLSQQCHITMHVEKDRHKAQPNYVTPSALEEGGSVHELPGMCVCLVCVCFIFDLCLFFGEVGEKCLVVVHLHGCADSRVLQLV